MKKTYSEKLRDPRWQKKRLKILERDHWTCVYCASSDKTLDVHHSVYGRGVDPWDANDYFLITTCTDCHKQVELASEKWKEALGFLERRFMPSELMRLASAITMAALNTYRSGPSAELLLAAAFKNIPCERDDSYWVPTLDARFPLLYQGKDSK
jgi:hypothetical protein